MDFDALIPRFRAPLIGFFAGQGTPWGEASDLAQDVFVAAYLGQAALRGSLEDRAAVGRWLRGIARNKLRERARRRSRERHDAIDPALLPQPETSDAVDAPAAALRRAIDALPENLRTVVYMHHLDEVAVADVAALLGLSARAVEGRLYRARARLESALQPTLRPALDATAQGGTP